MIPVFFILLVVGAVLFGALRIIVGWTTSKQTAAKFDRGAQASFKLVFQIGVLLLAAVIIFVIYLSFHQ